MELINNCLLYLSPSDIIDFIKNDIKFKNSYISFLVKKINKIDISKNNLSLTNYLNFTTLPTKILITHLYNSIKIIDNKYYLIGRKGDRILPGDRYLPHFSMNSIPFTFGYIKNNKYNLINSNIYYFEIDIDNKHHRIKWNNECISIGFSIHNYIMFNKPVGWIHNSIGYHSDDGKIFHENKYGENFSYSYGLGDTVGAGLIYIDINTYQPFFTLNGNILKTLKPIVIIGKIIPVIGFDSSIAIKVNFSSHEFKFDIEKMINNNNNNKIISSTNYFINNGYKLKLYNYSSDLIKYICRRKINTKKSNIFINYIPISPIISIIPVENNIINNTFQTILYSSELESSNILNI